MTQIVSMTEQEQQQWVRDQYKIATKFLAEKGLLTESVAEKESKYLIPYLAIWKINLTDKSSVWAVSGDLPTDFSTLSVAQDAREAVRHFSFKWQMKADELLKNEDKEQEQFAKLLIGRAEGLYDLFDKDELWQVKTA
jgi:hypothetical protein